MPQVRVPFLESQQAISATNQSGTLLSRLFTTIRTIRTYAHTTVRTSWHNDELKNEIKNFAMFDSVSRARRRLTAGLEVGLGVPVI